MPPQPAMPGATRHGPHCLRHHLGHRLGHRLGRGAAACLLLGGLSLPAPAGAAATPPAEAGPARVQLLSSVDETGPATRLTLAVRFLLEPGWKLYAPGPDNAGIAPDLDWAGSENLRHAEPHWPCPARLVAAGEPVLGYTGALLVPVVVEPVARGRAMAIVLSVAFAVCKEVCLLTSAEVRLGLPAGVERASAEGPGIAAAMAAPRYSPGGAIACQPVSAW